MEYNAGISRNSYPGEPTGLPHFRVQDEEAAAASSTRRTHGPLAAAKKRPGAFVEYGRHQSTRPQPRADHQAARTPEPAQRAKPAFPIPTSTRFQTTATTSTQRQESRHGDAAGLGREGILRHLHSIDQCPFCKLVFRDTMELCKHFSGHCTKAYKVISMSPAALFKVFQRRSLKQPKPQPKPRATTGDTRPQHAQHLPALLPVYSASQHAPDNLYSASLCAVPKQGYGRGRHHQRHHHHHHRSHSKSLASGTKPSCCGCRCAISHSAGTDQPCPRMSATEASSCPEPRTDRQSSSGGISETGLDDAIRHQLTATSTPAFPASKRQPPPPRMRQNLGRQPGSWKAFSSPPLMMEPVTIFSHPAVNNPIILQQAAKLATAGPSSRFPHPACTPAADTVAPASEGSNLLAPVSQPSHSATSSGSPWRIPHPTAGDTVRMDSVPPLKSVQPWKPYSSKSS